MLFEHLKLQTVYLMFVILIVEHLYRVTYLDIRTVIELHINNLYYRFFVVDKLNTKDECWLLSFIFVYL